MKRKIPNNLIHLIFGPFVKWGQRIWGPFNSGGQLFPNP